MRISRTTEESKFATRVLRDLQKEGGFSPQAAARLGLTFLAIVKGDDWSKIQHAVEENPLQVADALNSVSYAAGLPFDLPMDPGTFSQLNPDVVRKVVSAFDKITPWQVESIQAVAEIFAMSAFKDPQTPPAVAGLVAEIACPPAGATLFDPAVQAGMILLRTALRAENQPASVYGWSSPDDSDDGDAWKVAWLVLRASGVEDVKICSAPPQDVNHRVPVPQADIVVTDLTRVSVSRVRDERGPIPILQELLTQGSPLVLLVPSNLLADSKIADLRKSLMHSNLTAVIRLPVSLFPRVVHDVDLLVVRGGEEPCLEREIFFLDVAAYLAADTSRSLNAETSRMIGEMYRAFLEKKSRWAEGEIARFARAVNFWEVQEKQKKVPGSGLEVALYVPPVVEPIDLRTAFERLKKVKRERQEIEEELEERIDNVLKTNRF